MPKADRNQQSNTSRDSSSQDESAKKGRFVTDEERDELVEDAKRFKEQHDQFFRQLAGKDQ